MMGAQVPQEPQKSRTDIAKVKSIPHKGWAALVTFMAFITYVSTEHTCLPYIYYITRLPISI